jgi:hypothetical protein
MGKVNKPRKKVKPTKKSKVRQPLNGWTLRAAVTWALCRKFFASLKLHGNTTWQMTELLVLATMWVWSDNKTLTGAFAEASRWSIDLLGKSALGTYQGLLSALVTWTKQVLPLIQQRLQQLMEEQGGEHYRCSGWVPIAVDGSRISVPRTAPNEAAFCAQNYGKSSKAKTRKKKRAQSKAKRYRKACPKAAPQGPQIWTTLLWHMGLMMPWCWRNGPSDSCERTHFQEMLQEEIFPKNTLFCCDAGFVGYELWKAMIDRGYDFLIRVGGNVRLLQELGYYAEEKEGIVYLWPEKMAKQRLPPLVLRLIEIRVGKTVMALITNVLDKRRLSPKQAKIFYKMRWGIELQFRTLKQTFERRVLRSRTPDRALVELNWSFVGLWLIQLFAIKEQLQLGKLPENCSVGLAINVFRETFERWWERPRAGADFASRLGAAVKDQYVRKRSKQGRYKPQSGSKPSCGKPIIIKATNEHKKRLEKYYESTP